VDKRSGRKIQKRLKHFLHGFETWIGQREPLDEDEIQYLNGARSIITQAALNQWGTNDSPMGVAKSGYADASAAISAAWNGQDLSTSLGFELMLAYFSQQRNSDGTTPAEIRYEFKTLQRFTIQSLVQSLSSGSQPSARCLSELDKLLFHPNTNLTNNEPPIVAFIGESRKWIATAHSLVRHDESKAYTEYCEAYLDGFESGILSKPDQGLGKTFEIGRTFASICCNLAVEQANTSINGTILTFIMNEFQGHNGGGN